MKRVKIYVVWYPERSNQQNVYYLHGALHLFDAGAEIKKVHMEKDRNYFDETDKRATRE